MAFSRRTSDVKCPFLDSEGNEVGAIYTEKKAGYCEIPAQAKFWIKRYWTNSNYPEHEIFQISTKLEVICTINRHTTPQDISKLDLPKKIKEYMLEDIF